MGTNIGSQKICIHCLRRHELTTVRTAKHNTTVRRKTNRIGIELPVILILASRQKAAHQEGSVGMRQEEGISHRGNPDLPVGIFYHRFYMRIVHQHIHTAHILLIHIHEIKTIPHRTQPQIAIRILSYKGWVHIAIMRHSRHLQLLQFTGLGREDCKMHTCHKQQDITIAEPCHLRIIRIMGTGNPEGIRLQIIKPETQKIPITATHIEMTVYRQAVTQHRTNHRRLMEHLHTLVADTATQHLMIAHQPGMLVIIFHHVVEIDFPRGRKRIEDGSQGSLTNLLSLLIIDKDTEGCTCQDMFSHSRQ